MATKKKKVYKNYQDYLNSQEWDKHRKLAHNRVIKEYNNKDIECECCSACKSDIEINVHHFKYPKNWNDDSQDNLVVLCKECHDFVHSDTWKDFGYESHKTRQLFLRDLHLANNELVIEKINLQDDIITDYLFNIHLAIMEGKIELKKKFCCSKDSSINYWQTYLNNRMLCPPAENMLIEYINR